MDEEIKQKIKDEVWAIMEELPDNEDIPEKVASMMAEKFDVRIKIDYVPPVHIAAPIQEEPYHSHSSSSSSDFGSSSSSGGFDVGGGFGGFGGGMSGGGGAGRGF